MISTRTKSWRSPPGREPLLDVHTQMEMFWSYLDMAGDMACYCLYSQKGPGEEQSRIGAGIKERLVFYGPVEDILGHPMEKLIGEFPDWPSLVHPEDWLDRKENQSAIYSNRAITCANECRMLREDGQVRWIEEKVRAFFDTRRRTFHIQGFLRDITGRRRMEQNNERLRCILREQSANLRYMDDSRWKPRFKSEDFGTLSPSEMRCVRTDRQRRHDKGYRAHDGHFSEDRGVVQGLDPEKAANQEQKDQPCDLFAANRRLTTNRRALFSFLSKT